MIVIISNRLQKFDLFFNTSCCWWFITMMAVISSVQTFNTPMQFHKLSNLVLREKGSTSSVTAEMIIKNIQVSSEGDKELVIDGVRLGTGDNEAMEAVQQLWIASGKAWDMDYIEWVRRDAVGTDPDRPPLRVRFLVSLFRTKAQAALEAMKAASLNVVAVGGPNGGGVISTNVDGTPITTGTGAGGTGQGQGGNVITTGDGGNGGNTGTNIGGGGGGAGGIVTGGQGNTGGGGTNTGTGTNIGSGSNTGGGETNIGGGSNTGGGTNTGGGSNTGGGINTGGGSNTGGGINTGGGSNTGGGINTGGGSNTGGGINTGGGSNTGGGINTGGGSNIGGGGTNNGGGSSTGGGGTNAGGSGVVSSGTNVPGGNTGGNTGNGGGGSTGTVGGNPSGTNTRLPQSNGNELSIQDWQNIRIGSATESYLFLQGIDFNPPETLGRKIVYILQSIGVRQNLADKIIKSFQLTDGGRGSLITFTDPTARAFIQLYLNRFIKDDGYRKDEIVSSSCTSTPNKFSFGDDKCTCCCGCNEPKYRPSFLSGVLVQPNVASGQIIRNPSSGPASSGSIRPTVWAQGTDPLRILTTGGGSSGTIDNGQGLQTNRGSIVGAGGGSLRQDLDCRSAMMNVKDLIGDTLKTYLSGYCSADKDEASVTVISQVKTEPLSLFIVNMDNRDLTNHISSIPNDADAPVPRA